VSNLLYTIFKKLSLSFSAIFVYLTFFSLHNQYLEPFLAGMENIASEVNGKSICTTNSFHFLAEKRQGFGNQYDI
jgi:hypothetical protein